MHTTFNIPYVYNYITKFCRQPAQVIQNQENSHIQNIGQGKAKDREYERHNLAAVKHMTDQVTKNAVVTGATFDRA
jgi:hypothetical protein